MCVFQRQRSGEDRNESLENILHCYRPMDLCVFLGDSEVVLAFK